MKNYKQNSCFFFVCLVKLMVKGMGWGDEGKRAMGGTMGKEVSKRRK